MLIIPAIDLKDHRVVRLLRGEMRTTTVYSDDPLAMAQKWVDAGARRIHVVDLNGAIEGKPVHFEEIRHLVEHFPDVVFEVGGGIRDFETVGTYFQSGVAYCVLGTAALNNPEFVDKACKEFMGKIILGIDARKGRVAYAGWEKQSEARADSFAAEKTVLGIAAVIYTDINRDGAMGGMNLRSIKKVATKSLVPVIASGGLSSIDEIPKLKEIANVIGVVVGKALYEGKLDLKKAIEVASC